MRTHTADTTSATLTLRLPPKLKARLGELAERTRRTKSFLAGEAIAGYVERELEIVAGIEQGIEDVKAGRVVSHDEAMADINARIRKARAKAGRRKR
jgi:predicted transcriptional regulator